MILWFIPKPGIQILPAVSAFVFAPYWVEAAYVSMVVILFLGTVQLLIEVMGVYGER